MTVKEFFKSKTFRCIIVLLCIALVSGGLLAICNDLLSVSKDERRDRAIKSIFDENKESVGVYDEDENEQTYIYYVIDEKTEEKKEIGKINVVYKLTESGNYLIKATGFDGYQKGSVSIWCVAEFKDGAFSGLSTKDIKIAGNEKQTLMSKFNDSELKGYLTDGEKVTSGATYSSQAVRNAVATVRWYASTVLEGGAK